MAENDTTTTSPFDNPLCPSDYRGALDRALEQRRALVVSTQSCPACVRAKNLLDRSSIKYAEVRLDFLGEDDQIAVSKCVYGDEWNRRRYVPVIYLD